VEHGQRGVGVARRRRGIGGARPDYREEPPARLIGSLEGKRIHCF